MSAPYHTLLSLFFAALFLTGIRLMRSPRTAVAGNLVGALGMLGAIVATLAGEGLVSVRLVWMALAAGAGIGYIMAIRATMIRMPQMVALLNGLGGGASACAGLVVVGNPGAGASNLLSAALAVVVGGVTFSGSLVAALKLDRKLPQRPIRIPGHSTATMLVLLITGALLPALLLAGQDNMGIPAAGIVVGGLLFGILFTIRIGGADMPIAISLLNSLSGLAAAIAGFAVRDPLPVAAGAIVGSAGLILTRIMCRAMNRSLFDILLGRTTGSLTSSATPAHDPGETPAAENRPDAESLREENPVDLLHRAKTVIIIPGYGMALSQAQHQVKALYDLLERMGKEVRFAIHPVAGRMPGHMNVLLAEADVPYEILFEMDAVNPLFPETDLVIIVGANDVVNPAAATAQGTPIYGMPILNAGEAGHILIFNKDTRPGYAGVDNPLYDRPNVALFPGDAGEEIGELLEKLKTSGEESRG